VISDVVGDPLDVIASGPTVADASTAADAWAVLERYAPTLKAIPQSIRRYLQGAAADPAQWRPVPATVSTHVIGDNDVALAAAARRASQLGYKVHSLGSDNQGVARDVGRALADFCRDVRDNGSPLAAPACVLSGGEPVVHLAPAAGPRSGGRNQELVLGAVVQLWDDGMRGLAVLSGGTDGEDGPTDAAGAVADAELIESARALGLDPVAYLANNDSYSFFAHAGGLIKTGPTHTNVMDLRVGLIGR
jgi:glycerate-2-kinase